MMAIVMAGGVYCPLSPRDPNIRLNELTEQLSSPLILVHGLTKQRFLKQKKLYNLDLFLISQEGAKNIDVNKLSNLNVESEQIAYIIFTSGSTGLPKAVSPIDRGKARYLNRWSS